MNAHTISGLQANLIGDSKRLHIHHGPTDLIIDADGPQRLKLFELAVSAMQDILAELAQELMILRAPFDARCPPSSPVGRRMHDACGIAGKLFVTPMAAVAGAIADYVLDVMVKSELAKSSSKISVNNGGDIAFWTGNGAVTHAAIASSAWSSMSATITIVGPTIWNGMATSGFGGRSFSFGIADSVTVLANCAATADVAATLIAGAVNCPEERAILRLPAHDLDPDSDLGSKLITVNVPPLGRQKIVRALKAGEDLALQLIKDGKIAGAVLELQGETLVVGFSDSSALFVN